MKKNNCLIPSVITLGIVAGCLWASINKDKDEYVQLAATAVGGYFGFLRGNEQEY